MKIGELLELLDFYDEVYCRERCKDCAYLVEGEHGEWICDDCGREIVDILDDECSANMDW